MSTLFSSLPECNTQCQCSAVTAWKRDSKGPHQTQICRSRSASNADNPDHGTLRATKTYAPHYQSLRTRSQSPIATLAEHHRSIASTITASPSPEAKNPKKLKGAVNNRYGDSPGPGPIRTRRPACQRGECPHMPMQVRTNRGDAEADAHPTRTIPIMVRYERRKHTFLFRIRQAQWKLQLKATQ